ncbi:MAG: MFS transporter [Clostridia bacterium]|nr:MFS transporter [Clostridia bacterium]
MKVTWRDKFYYGIGNLGYSTIASTLSNFMMFFGTSVLGVSGILMGLAISISVVWDAVSDPIVGYYSDNSNSALGKRHSFILVGILGMCAINLVIWLIPVSAPEGIKFVWILFSLLSVQTFCTLFSTPYLALGLDMTNDPHQQTSIQCTKTIFFLLGMMLPTTFMFLFMPSSAGTQGQLLAQGYINIAYAASSICLVFGLITFFGTIKWGTKFVCSSYKTEFKKEKISSIFNDYFKLIKKKNYRNIIFGYAISIVASTTITASGLHMFTYCFHFNSQQISMVMGSLLVGAILSQLFWGALSKKIGKKMSLIRGLSIGILGIILVWGIFTIRGFLTTETLLYVTMPIIFIIGFGTGVLYSFPISILSDIMAADKELIGKNKYGTYSSMATLTFKMSDAFSLMVIGIVLDLIKFSAASPVQPLSVQKGLGLLVILGAIISLGLSILVYNKYKETSPEA